MDYKQLYTQKIKPPKTTITIQAHGVDRQIWAEFQGYCRFERTTATQKLKDLIAQYVADQGKESE